MLITVSIRRFSHIFGLIVKYHECDILMPLLLTEGFKHLGDAALLLLHVWMDIEVEGRRDIGVS